MMRAIAGVLAVMALMGCDQRPTTESEIATAVRDNNVRAVTDYLAQGGDVNAVSRDGVPLLYLATGPRGGLDVLIVLLRGGADVEKLAPNGRTPLMNAAGWCDAEMVRVLLAAGADRRRVGPDSKTARDSVCSGPLDRRAAVLNILDSTP